MVCRKLNHSNLRLFELRLDFCNLSRLQPAAETSFQFFSYL
jgi:hypothetical protein